jgi:hypothetical protein
MKRLRRFFALRFADQRLLLLAGLLLVTIKLGLRWLPFPAVLRVLRGLQKTRVGSYSLRSYSRFQVIQAVEVVSCRIPGDGSCLVRALAVQVLLGQQGCQTQLRMGVALGADGKFVAHAWVEKHGRILAGNRENLPLYRVLHPITENRT